MTIFSYVIPRDFGFAPNPFYNICSLATCKPKIRKNATLGDWVLGFGSADSRFKEKLVYAMKVDNKITFDEYWNMDAFQCKKPIMNGSIKQSYGDNIYHYENGEWKQEDSHHSLEGGAPNEKNITRDTSSNNVLLSSYFWYFGKEAVDLPNELQILIHRGRNHSKFTILEPQLEEWLKKLPKAGIIGDPAMFSGGFKRYDGES